MTQQTDYIVKEIFSSVANMKVLKIYGNLEFNEHAIIHKIWNVTQDFLVKNKDVDYLIVYYFPSYEDMENNAALCFFTLEENIDVSVVNIETIEKNLRWNEDYGFFSAILKNKISLDNQLVNEASSMLQIIEDAYFILYELEMTQLYKTFTGFETYYEILEHWIMKAETFNNTHGELERTVTTDLKTLIRHMSNIFYCCLSSIGKNLQDDKDKQWIFNHELANAKDKFEVVHHQLLYLLRKYLQ